MAVFFCIIINFLCGQDEEGDLRVQRAEGFQIHDGQAHRGGLVRPHSHSRSPHQFHYHDYCHLQETMLLALFFTLSL
jgi:hypothetical protein